MRMTSHRSSGVDSLNFKLPRVKFSNKATIGWFVAQNSHKKKKRKKKKRNLSLRLPSTTPYSVLYLLPHVLVRLGASETSAILSFYKQKCQQHQKDLMNRKVFALPMFLFGTLPITKRIDACAGKRLSPKCRRITKSGLGVFSRHIDGTDVLSYYTLVITIKM